ncbi:MAG: bacillithiol system redox-active protein YtxJ, partial [Flavobacteriales bacterium]
MNWLPLTELAQLDTIDAASAEKPVLIYKHSTTCSISRTAKDRLERAWTAENDAQHTVYYLDLLRFRSISNAIAVRYGVEHESPQVLVIDGGKCRYSSSHFG